jgi:hypothetical protein
VVPLHVVTDDQFAEVVDLLGHGDAGTDDADVVFDGGRKRSPAGKAVFASAARGTLPNADAPVTFGRERDLAGNGRGRYLVEAPTCFIMGQCKSWLHDAPG